MLQYEIAEIKMSIDHNRSKYFKRLKNFKSAFITRPDIEIRFQSSGSLAAPKCFTPNDDWISWYSENTHDMISSYIYLKETGRIEYKIETKDNWSDITIFYNEKAEGVERAFCTYLGSFILSNKVILHDSFILHASSISCSQKGIAFTAPSGTGKSTHAALWEKYYNASILNDDCPIIKCKNDQSYIFGTPWSGSNNKAINTNVLLTAIVILERSTQNSICELTNKEAIPLILPRIFLPYQNADLMATALQHAERIIKNVPIYLLKCRPDREAVELVYQCIR